MVQTERMKLIPLSVEELDAVVENEPDMILQMAYEEMLDGCRRHPDRHLWYTLWKMQLIDGSEAFVGDLSFKGLENGTVEIGYGMVPAYEGRGYMTEAVDALVHWAAKQDGVENIEAEAEEENTASIRVLTKCGFVRNGVMGLEGPRFVWKG